MPRCGNIAPTDRHGLLEAGAEIDLAARCLPRCDDPIAPPYPRALANALDARLARPVRPRTKAGDTWGEFSCIGKPRLHMGGQAIARHHVEADAGHQHHARRLSLLVPSSTGLKNVDLARNIEIMGAGADAGIDHGL